MILDSLANSDKYVSLNKGFKKAFEFLKKRDLSDLTYGRHDIDGDNIFVMISDNEGQGTDKVRLEAHKNYIDIQFVIKGEDLIGWRPVADCRESFDYNSSKDCTPFGDEPESWLELSPGNFTVFFPHDAHAPLAGKGQVRKAVVKVKV